MLWYHSGLFLRCLADSVLVLVAYVLPLSKVWEHWDIVNDTHFVMIHHGIILWDLSLSKQHDATGQLIMTAGQTTVYWASIFYELFVDFASLWRQIDRISSDASLPRDTDSEEHMQLVVICLMIVLALIRTIYFSLHYSHSPTHFDMHPLAVATIAHDNRHVDTSYNTAERDDGALALNSQYERVATSKPRDSVGGNLGARRHSAQSTVFSKATPPSVFLRND
jgi:hypothetical protein